MAGYYNRNNMKKTGAQEKGSNKHAAAANIIGEPFHNPYTFIPFPDHVVRHLPTPMTADERPSELDRKSGILELKITTISPLMTCDPVPDSEKSDHKTYSALTNGSDVIFPSTGVRGALRTLMTIISGGTLGYMDEDLWLTQDRDAQLGPSTKNPKVPDHAFLAEVIKPGTHFSPGVIQLGETKLIKADTLRSTIGNLDYIRPSTGKKPLTYIDSSQQKWKVKLSGRPIKPRNKKEGLFRGIGQRIELSESFWKDYQGRNRHSFKKELKKGDLIWLEPVDKSCNKITRDADIKSIQWSRWGRQGVALKSIVPPAVLPDSMRNDGCVDMVTDLFGQIPHVSGAAGPFAGRIRPGNLVFFDAQGEISKEILAPLAAPHPGCIAFYRDREDLDLIDQNSPLKGYKVYRNTKERGDEAPWKYTVQGVYAEKGALKKPHQQKVNKTAELLNEGITGTLRISFRALSSDELALLFAVCSVDWKLGGGKPLGLGHCRVTDIKMIDEDGGSSVPMETNPDGENLQLFPDDQKRVAHLTQRISLYRASQAPVEKLRYPRAVTKNRNKSSRAGLAWFARHASSKKVGPGLETIWTAGRLKEKAGASQIKAQALPHLDPDDPTKDYLYGYDVVELDVDPSNRNQRMVGWMEKFEPDIHAVLDEKSSENISQSRETRKAARAERRIEAQPVLPAVTKENIYNVIQSEFENKQLTPTKAKAFLEKFRSFEINQEQSKKWRNQFKLLNSIASKNANKK
jgi:hypothetical protein